MDIRPVSRKLAGDLSELEAVARPLAAPVSPVTPASPARTSSAVLTAANPIARSRSLWRSAVYLPEFALMLLMLFAVVSAVTTLVGVGVESLTATKDGAQSNSLIDMSGFTTFQALSSLSTLVIALPLFIFLYIRTVRTEVNEPERTRGTWRRGLLAAFLVIEGLALVSGLVAMVYALLSRYVKAGGDPWAGSGTLMPWWAVVLIGGVNALITFYVIWTMSRSYRGKSDAA